MPTAYEKTYGAVKFYETDGTPIFDTEDDLDLWTTMDDEPSPEPKWIRVDVPGADGAVDLSRALAGQTTYEMREIRLGFGGKCADHATALALVHQMRRALHGARVRVETLLTAQIGGWYIADCECDGIAYASGDVEVTVNATADPFIRVGTQSLALPALTIASDLAPVVELPADHDPSVATWRVQPFGIANGTICPIGADVVRLWWAMGDNLFDASAWPYVTSGDLFDPGVNGQAIFMSVGTYLTLGDATFQLKASSRTGTWPAWPYSFPFSCFDSDGGQSIAAAGQKLVAYVTGTVTAVGTSPHVKLTAIAEGTGTDADGFVSGLTTSQSFTPSVGSVSQTLTIDLASATWSGAGARAISAIEVEAKNVSCAITVGLALVTGTAPATWEAARLGSADVTLPQPLGWYHAIATSDMARVFPYHSDGRYKVEFANGISTGPAPLTTLDASAGGNPPPDAAYVSAALMCDGGPSGHIALWGSIPESGTASSSNTTMRAVPTLTSTDGASVTIDGRTAIVGPGTVALAALTIPGGTFTVDYTLFGSSDATLSWEGGVL